MLDILIKNNIFNKSFTLKEIAVSLKHYCDMYFLLQLTDKQFLEIILYFYSIKSTFLQPDGTLNSTLVRILGKKRSFTILILLKNYFDNI